MSNEIREKSPKIVISLKIGGIVVGLLGLASLINNIMLFKTTIDQYLQQGYPIEMVMEAMVPSQLLPGIFEAIGLYGGLAFLMFAVAVIAGKILPKEEIVIKDSPEAVTEGTIGEEIEEIIEEIGRAHV